nr:MAG: RNA replicase beta chain [Sanya fiers-like virus 13]UUW21260.1 MAG: RNA replicase beta chain [Sanya fiers-like virus 13]
METKNNLGSDLAFVINVHERLSRDLPSTPYNLWCKRVHSLKLAPRDKWDFLLSWDINPSEYQNPTLFASDYQLRSLLSKYSTDEVSDADGQSVAYRKFLDSEVVCSAVNDLLSTRIRPSGLNQLLELAKKIVADCLGDVEEFFTSYRTTLHSVTPSDIFSNIDALAAWSGRVPDGLEFGPGVSVSEQGPTLRSTVEKVELGTVTSNCWAVFRPLYDELVLPRPSLVKGSKLAFVPKKVGEMRAICIEPSVNMLFQKPIGRWIRRKLKAYFGINLRDQSRNRRMAHLGSLCDSYSTLDLSSASDLNAYCLILELLPPQWFQVLDSLRSEQYWDPVEKVHRPFEKFSTMGNGFTFELETLIFSAVVLAGIKLWGDPAFDRHDMVAYGDDIIVPKSHYDIAVQSLAVIGHSPNLKKSYRDGPFRESCGGDFFNGWDVTPVKIKELRLEDPTTVIEIHNRLFGFCASDHILGAFLHWDSHALVFIRAWLHRTYPRVSGGPLQWVTVRESGQRVNRLVSSNQWLWGSSHNTKTYDSRLMPKWVCILVEDVVCEYHVPPTSSHWLIGQKQRATVTVTRSVQFARAYANRRLSSPHRRLGIGNPSGEKFGEKTLWIGDYQVA